MTDLQIFRSLSGKDSWVDAQLPSLFIYLYGNKNLVVPNDWLDTMNALSYDMQQLVI